ncbi:MAG: co-chaperone GroES [Traorella sp.]
MLRPLNNQVVLRKEEVETKTSSGIILSSETKKLPSVGKVLALGEKCEADLKVNDKVVYKEYSGTSITLDHEDYIVIEDKDILAVIE